MTQWVKFLIPRESISINGKDAAKGGASFGETLSGSYMQVILKCWR
ncbi:MAG: hypothetical protein OSA97_20515 [Nevskia sp.]|nr:hypothetical protein [Nevskia sp.]